jgi:16S rRNA processing protein RimM
LQELNRRGSCAIAEEFITIARVLKPQGRHGEVAVELFTSFPERFAERKQVWALDPAGSRRELRVEDVWSHKGRIILKFASVDDIGAAESLAGCEIQVPRSQRTELEAGDVYVSDLVGCKVFDGGTEVGTVSDVTFGAGEAPLLVVQAGNRALEIPLATEYIVRQDLEAKRLELKLPEGMLDLDAPLSADEKKQQHRK